MTRHLALRLKKYTATRAEIVNDFYDEIQRAKAKYADKPDALMALEEIEEITIWWFNAPVVTGTGMRPMSSNAQD